MSMRALFALYIESAGPGQLAASVAKQHGAEAVAAARVACAGRLTLLATRIGDVGALLGPADARTTTTLGYAFSSRPGYRYLFEFSGPDGVLLRHRFRRVGLTPPMPSRSAHRKDGEFVAQLAAIGATMDEVRSLLGEPESEYGWWPIDGWRYDDSLVIEFRHGVVEHMPNATRDAVLPED